ncbi:hypothetical protein DM992_40640 (plasmid) [Burkholderia sp. JP2-270]|nr:hypothetical protein DM992_40640 [Burkholderia sp. JP2-270]
MKVAVDGRLTSADDATCRAGAKVDLVSTTPVTKTTATGVTSWPLTKSECAALAAKLLEKGAIRINGSSVDQPDQITSACSKSSNSVTLTR